MCVCVGPKQQDVLVLRSPMNILLDCPGKRMSSLIGARQAEAETPSADLPNSVFIFV